MSTPVNNQPKMPQFKNFNVDDLLIGDGGKKPGGPKKKDDESKGPQGMGSLGGDNLKLLDNMKSMGGSKKGGKGDGPDLLDNKQQLNQVMDMLTKLAGLMGGKGGGSDVPAPDASGPGKDNQQINQLQGNAGGGKKPVGDSGGGAGPSGKLETSMDKLTKTLDDLMGSIDGDKTLDEGDQVEQNNKLDVGDNSESGSARSGREMVDKLDKQLDSILDALGIKDADARAEAKSNFMDKLADLVGDLKSGKLDAKDILGSVGGDTDGDKKTEGSGNKFWDALAVIADFVYRLGQICAGKGDPGPSVEGAGKKSPDMGDFSKLLDSLGKTGDKNVDESKTPQKELDARTDKVIDDLTGLRAKEMGITDADEIAKLKESIGEEVRAAVKDNPNALANYEKEARMSGLVDRMLDSEIKNQGLTDKDAISKLRGEIEAKVRAADLTEGGLDKLEARQAKSERMDTLVENRAAILAAKDGVEVNDEIRAQARKELEASGMKPEMSDTELENLEKQGALDKRVDTLLDQMVANAKAEAEANGEEFDPAAFKAGLYKEHGETLLKDGVALGKMEQAEAQKTDRREVIDRLTEAGAKSTGIDPGDKEAMAALRKDITEKLDAHLKEFPEDLGVLKTMVNGSQRSLTNALGYVGIKGEPTLLETMTGLGKSQRAAGNPMDMMMRTVAKLLVMMMKLQANSRELLNNQIETKREMSTEKSQMQRDIADQEYELAEHEVQRKINNLIFESIIMVVDMIGEAMGPKGKMISKLISGGLNIAKSALDIVMEKQSNLMKLAIDYAKADVTQHEGAEEALQTQIQATMKELDQVMGMVSELFSQMMELLKMAAEMEQKAASVGV